MEDESLCDAAAACWPGSPPPVLSQDGLFGFGGAAAVAFTTAQAVLTTGGSEGSDTLVTALDPEGGITVLRVGAPEGQS